MGNPEHEAILRQGVDVWNEWRKDNPNMQPDLYKSDFSAAHLAGAYFYAAECRQADFAHADLSECNFARSNLFGADFKGANLTNANLSLADLGAANLNDCILSGAALLWTNLHLTSLRNAVLSKTKLYRTVFNYTFIDGADFTNAICEGTLFSDLDLSTAKGLDKVVFQDQPSSIGIDTLLKSKGQIPESFLRGCGVSDKIIALLPSLLD